MPDPMESDLPAPRAEASEKSSTTSEECRLCQDTGTMSWQQPCPDGTMRTMEWPCPSGCGGHWKHPAAEGDRVIAESPGDLPARRGGAAEEASRIGAEFIADALRGWGFDQQGRE